MLAYVQYKIIMQMVCIAPPFSLSLSILILIILSVYCGDILNFVFVPAQCGDMWES